MAKSDALLKALATAVAAGGGIPSTAELALQALRREATLRSPENHSH
jgi:hypothetical protein